MTFKGELKWFFLMLFGVWLVHFCTYSHYSPESLGLFLFPVLLALVLRTVFTPMFAGHLVLVLMFSLNEISDVKYFFSQKVLESHDFGMLTMASQVSNYLPLQSLLLILAVSGTLFIPYKKFQLTLKLAPLAILVVLGHFNYATNMNFMKATNKALENYANIKFDMFSLRANVRNNGILLHLAQTLSLGNKLEKGTHTFYDGLKRQRNVSNVPSAKGLAGYDIFLIVCESCFFEDKKDSPFHNDMARLTQEGYQHTAMVSPVYGGGTSEAEFELMTGLPSKVLPGIKFQLYATSFSENAQGLPSLTKELGYTSFYYHNSKAIHWRRDQVIKKFGYKDAYFMEDMNFFETNEWARDYYLYNKAVSQYEQSIQSKTPVFNQLMTVYTHGVYKVKNGDNGLADYSHRISLSITDYIEFERKISQLATANGREVAFFLVGDHKPSLSETFYKSATLSPNNFASNLEATLKNDYRFNSDLDVKGLIETGSVPLFIKTVGKNRNLAAELESPLESKPFFCFPGYIASEMDTSKSRYFLRLKEICEENPSQVLISPEWQRKNFPVELFAELLF
jgi:phosphoglycerol transferase MdoB-like AlkP superfamily enzyme